MKKFISLLIASIIVGFGVFVMMYWIVGSDFSDSKIMAITAGITGLFVELLRPQIAKWSKMLDIAARRKPTKR